MNKFVSDIQANPLAVIVFVALVMSEITSLSLMMRTTPVSTAKSWYSGLLALFALLGLPAILDLLQTSGITMVFAVVVLGILLLNVIIPLLNFTQKSPSSLVVNWYKWSIPILVTGGLVVAGYLTYVDVTATPPVCGIAVHGCVTVQASSYARLFGFLPVGLIGLIGYLAILAVWLLGQFGAASLKKASGLAIWSVCFFGMLFSAYLTYLEPFVIRATCTWCITSAVLMILLLWVSTPAAQGTFMVSQEDE